MIEVQKSIKKRKRGRPVRLELEQHCDKEIREFLIEMLKINEKDIYELTGPLDLTFLSKVAGIPGCASYASNRLSLFLRLRIFGGTAIFLKRSRRGSNGSPSL